MLRVCVRFSRLCRDCPDALQRQEADRSYRTYCCVQHLTLYPTAPMDFSYPEQPISIVKISFHPKTIKQVGDCSASLNPITSPAHTENRPAEFYSKPREVRNTSLGLSRQRISSPFKWSGNVATSTGPHPQCPSRPHFTTKLVAQAPKYGTARLLDPESGIHASPDPDMICDFPVPGIAFGDFSS